MAERLGGLPAGSAAGFEDESRARQVAGIIARRDLRIRIREIDALRTELTDRDELLHKFTHNRMIGAHLISLDKQQMAGMLPGRLKDGVMKYGFVGEETAPTRFVNKTEKQKALLKHHDKHGMTEARRRATLFHMGMDSAFDGLFDANMDEQRSQIGRALPRLLTLKSMTENILENLSHDEQSVRNILDNHPLADYEVSADKIRQQQAAMAAAVAAANLGQ